jgi:hypothetical protein
MPVMLIDIIIVSLASENDAFPLKLNGIGRWGNAIKLTRHLGKDRRDPEYRDVIETRHPWLRQIPASQSQTVAFSNPSVPE